MQLIYNIASRYLFKKKGLNVINIVTGISVIGIAVGTAALVLILSVFNGFEHLLSGMFNTFNPELKVIPTTGKIIDLDSSSLYKIRELEGVKACARVLEEVALFEYKGTQEIGIIKGVDEDWPNVIELDSFLRRGKYKIDNKQLNYGLLGDEIKIKLNVNVNDRLNPITVYMPLKRKKLLGGKEFTFQDLYPSGVFSVRSETDQQYVLASLKFTEKLLSQKNQYSALEIKMRSAEDEENIREAIGEILGDKVIIKNRFEQDEEFIQIMNIERWVSYLIVSLTLLLVVFNLFVCLWMIVLDKRKDIAVLKTLGMENSKISGIFLSVGGLITTIGLLIGFVLALILYFLQSKYGLIGIPDSFMISAYPIQLRPFDFVVVAFTVLILSVLASILPSIKAAKLPTQFS